MPVDTWEYCDLGYLPTGPYVGNRRELAVE
jgi:hypothetical protein